MTAYIPRDANCTRELVCVREAFEISGSLNRNESEAAVRGFFLQRLQMITSSSSVPEIDFHFSKGKSGLQFIRNKAQLRCFCDDFLKRLSRIVSGRAPRDGLYSGRRKGHNQLGLPVTTLGKIICGFFRCLSSLQKISF